MESDLLATLLSLREEQGSVFVALMAGKRSPYPGALRTLLFMVHVFFVRGSRMAALGALAGSQAILEP